MFDLEEKFFEWRQQMLAAGIQSPVPLEELAIHLREEIERQVQSGASEQTAFDVACAQIGQAEPIKSEFKKADGFLGWLGESRQARINRTFALLWLAYCSWFFFSIIAPLTALTDLRSWRLTPDLFVALFGVLVFLFGIIASITCLVATIAGSRRFGLSPYWDLWLLSHRLLPSKLFQPWRSR